MKNKTINLLILTILVTFFSACDSEGEVRELGVTAVKTLYEPVDGRTLVLQSSASAMLYFEWEPAKADDSGAVLYEIAFDKADGDFSNPVSIITADNNGGSNHATITHKQLNQIAALAGIESAEQGTLKWTVFSSKGINPVKAEQERTIVLTRLAGFANIPDQLFITGEGTEMGSDKNKAIKLKKINEGEFEIYTKLTEGKTISFVNSISDGSIIYSLNGEKIVEGGTFTVPKTGVYKFYLDFSIGSFTSKEVTKVSLFLCWSQLKIELPYKGLGVWELNGHTISGLTNNDNNDDRYKFRMESSTGETEWRSPANDSKPSGNEAYYYMVERDNVQQWTDGQIWKSPSSTGWSGKTYDLMFSLNPQGAYTHNLIIKE